MACFNVIACDSLRFVWIELNDLSTKARIISNKTRTPHSMPWRNSENVFVRNGKHVSGYYKECNYNFTDCIFRWSLLVTAKRSKCDAQERIFAYSYVELYINLNSMRKKPNTLTHKCRVEISVPVWNNEKIHAFRALIAS